MEGSRKKHQETWRGARYQNKAGCLDGKKKRQQEGWVSSRPKKRTQLKEHKPMEQRAVGEPAEMGPTGLPRIQGNKIAGKITAKGETDQKNRNQVPEKGPGSKLTRLIKEKAQTHRRISQGQAKKRLGQDQGRRKTEDQVLQADLCQSPRV